MLLEIDGRESVFMKNQSFLSINEDIWFYQNTEFIRFEYSYNTLKSVDLQDVHYTTQVKVFFDLTRYLLKITLLGNAEILIKEKNYAEFLTETEIEEISKFIAQEHKKFIENKLTLNLQS
jgi:hypothetical protein